MCMQINIKLYNLGNIWVKKLSTTVLAAQPADLTALMALDLNDAGDSVEVVRQALVVKIGENIFYFLCYIKTHNNRPHSTEYS